MDGKELPESYAIYRYLARKYGILKILLINLKSLGFAGRDEWETAILDAIADVQVDFWREMLEWYLKRAYDMGNGNLVEIFAPLKTRNLGPTL